MDCRQSPSPDLVRLLSGGAGAGVVERSRIGPSIGLPPQSAARKTVASASSPPRSVRARRRALLVGPGLSRARRQRFLQDKSPAGCAGCPECARLRTPDHLAPSDARPSAHRASPRVVQIWGAMLRSWRIDRHIATWLWFDLITHWLMIDVSPDSSTVFRTLADPTRRSLFEQLCREGEQTVWMLTRHARISQPAVSKHLAALKSAGLVHDRREGRERHYRAVPKGLSPLVDWLGLYGAFWRDRLDRLEDLLERIDQ